MTTTMREEEATAMGAHEKREARGGGNKRGKEKKEKEEKNREGNIGIFFKKNNRKI